MTTVLTADGCQEVLDPADTSCCPPPLCGNDLCCSMVAFMNLLPTGPIWDVWKAAAISYFQTSDDPSQCPLLRDPACPSLVLHAVYTVLKLRNLVHKALWPAFRESNPITAVTTMDDHLARYFWEDCYLQHCRTVLGKDLTPYEVMSECGPVFCPPDFPPELENAVKHNTLVALTRANTGVIKNLCGINWVIEPLGAELVPIVPAVCPPDPPDAFDPPPGCVDPVEPGCVDCEPDACPTPAFVLAPTRDWIEGIGTGDLCEQLASPKVQAYWDRPCDRPAGLPAQIWPAVLTAECIARSLLPPACPSNIIRSC